MVKTTTYQQIDQHLRNKNRQRQCLLPGLLARKQEAGSKYKGAAVFDQFVKSVVTNPTALDHGAFSLATLLQLLKWVLFCFFLFWGDLVWLGGISFLGLDASNS